MVEAQGFISHLWGDSAAYMAKLARLQLLPLPYWHARLSKAFDKVPHEKFMAKVEAHGIRNNYSRWIRNWLTGRTQRVVIHDETSDPALVTSGVPQGTQVYVLLRNTSSTRRLQRLELISLEQRRLRGQLIETFKYLNGLNNVTLEGPFERDGNVRTRNNGQKLLLRNFKTSQAMNFFPVKIASIWNQLPENIVSDGTVNTFKNRLDKFWITNPPSITSY
ncbi:Reverse transcriptase domain [Trinorchestia longiramus]|nr:Reverse transcriptase domain [Trinorchestia longiramus]